VYLLGGFGGNGSGSASHEAPASAVLKPETMPVLLLLELTYRPAGDVGSWVTAVVV
jgi:hypothetical protein